MDYNFLNTSYHGVKFQLNFMLSPMQVIQRQIIDESCALSHSNFFQKCSKPLWTRPEFFVTLPFKKSEDVNPTKASHKGLNPDLLKQAKMQLQQLQ